ncbi:transporter substrate-binding domain-containing protein [Legionella gratiana]
MKLKCTFVRMGEQQLFPALENRTIDLAISGIVISPQREETYLFSLPYLLNHGVFVVPPQSNLQHISDLKGKFVGVKNNQDDSVFGEYLQFKFSNQFQIKQYDTTEDMFRDLENGFLDAAFAHQEIVNYWYENGFARFKIIDRPHLVGYGIGIVGLPDKQDLINNINKELLEIDKTDFYLNLYKTYFGNQ